MSAATVIGVLALVVARPAVAQIELDRTVQRVYGTAIMASDLRQARLLRLVPNTADDDAVLEAIENRLLQLREVSRGQVGGPEADAVAARRAAWQAAWPAGTNIPELLARAGMSDQALDAWFRDDLLIAAYLDRRFGPADDPRRADRVTSWIRDLRQRAGLPVR